MAIFILIAIGFIYNHINTFIIILAIILTIIITVSLILKLVKYWKTKRIKQKQESLRIQAQEEVRKAREHRELLRIQAQEEARKAREHQELLRIQAQEEARKAREHQDLLRIQAQENLCRKLREIGVSTNREDYVVNNEDYRRNNKRDKEYRKKYLLSLLSLYDTKCVKCQRVDNGLDLDHFFLSKSVGGNFSLQHKDGYLVNNAIPLCESCNRSKGDRPYANFFDKDQILFLFTKNREMNFLLNQIEPKAETTAPSPVSFSLPADIGSYTVAKPTQSECPRQVISEAVEKEECPAIDPAAASSNEWSEWIRRDA